MPMYEYKCPDCGHQFEELVSSGTETVPCPKCGSEKPDRLISTFAAGGFGGGSGSCSAPAGGGFT